MVKLHIIIKYPYI